MSELFSICQDVKIVERKETGTTQLTTILTGAITKQKIRPRRQKYILAAALRNRYVKYVICGAPRKARVKLGNPQLAVSRTFRVGPYRFERSRKFKALDEVGVGGSKGYGMILGTNAKRKKMQDDHDDGQNFWAQQKAPVRV